MSSAVISFKRSTTDCGDTGGKFATGVNIAGGEFAIGINDDGGPSYISHIFAKLFELAL